MLDKWVYNTFLGKEWPSYDRVHIASPFFWNVEKGGILTPIIFQSYGQGIIHLMANNFNKMNCFCWWKSPSMLLPCSILALDCATSSVGIRGVATLPSTDNRDVTSSNPEVESPSLRTTTGNLFFWNRVPAILGTKYLLLVLTSLTPGLSLW